MSDASASAAPRAGEVWLARARGVEPVVVLVLHELPAARSGQGLEPRAAWRVVVGACGHVSFHTRGLHIPPSLLACTSESGLSAGLTLAPRAVATIAPRALAQRLATVGSSVVAAVFAALDAERESRKLPPAPAGAGPTRVDSNRRDGLDAIALAAALEAESASAVAALYPPPDEEPEQPSVGKELPDPAPEDEEGRAGLPEQEREALLAELEPLARELRALKEDAAVAEALLGREPQTPRERVLAEMAREAVSVGRELDEDLLRLERAVLRLQGEAAAPPALSERGRRAFEAIFGRPLGESAHGPLLAAAEGPPRGGEVEEVWFYEEDGPLRAVIAIPPDLPHGSAEELRLVLLQEGMGPAADLAGAHVRLSDDEWVIGERAFAALSFGDLERARRAGRPLVVVVSQAGREHRLIEERR